MADPDQIPAGQGEALKLIHDKVDAHVQDTIRPEFQSELEALSTTLRQDTHEALRKAKVDHEREIALLKEANRTEREANRTERADAAKALQEMRAQLQTELRAEFQQTLAALPNNPGGNLTLQDPSNAIILALREEREAREESLKGMRAQQKRDKEEKYCDILKPEKFSQSSLTQSARRHCTDFEQYHDSRYGPDSDKVKYFSNYLEGKAIIWFRAYMTENPKVDYVTMKAAFLKYFKKEDDRFDAQALRKQEPNESVSDYAMALQKMATAHSKSKDRTREALLHGLREDISAVVIHKEAKTWSEILEVAEEYENQQKVSENRLKATLENSVEAKLEARLEAMQAQLKSMSQVNSMTAKTHKPQSNKNPPKKIKPSEPKPAQTETQSSEEEEQDLNLMSHEHLRRQEQRALKDQGKPPYNQNRNSGYSRGGYQGKNFNPDHKRPYRGGYRGRGGNNSNSHSQNYTQSRNQDNRSRDNNRRQDDQRRDYSSSRRDYSSSRDNQHSYRSRDNSKSRDTHQGYKPNTQGYNPNQQQPQQQNQQQPQQEDILQKIKQLLGSSNSGN